MLFKERCKGLGGIALLNVALFAPYFNARTYPHFSLDKIALLFCLSLTAALLLSRLVFVFFALFVLITSVFYLHISAHWPGSFADRISLVLESPAAERLEYLANYVSGIDVLILLYALACFIGAISVLRGRPRSSLMLRIVAPLPIAAVLVLVASSERFAKLPLVTLPVEVYDMALRVHQLEERNAHIAAMEFPAQDCGADYQNVVIVIGESSSADHNALYGYLRAGASRLSGLGMVQFSAIASANQTRYSVPMMLTRATPDRFDDFYREPSLVSELKACGYRTYWLSNQPQGGKHDDNIASISREADISLFLKGDDLRHTYDETLIDKARLINDNAGERERKAFFIHLAGSHFNYNWRFPDTFAPKSDDPVAAYDTTVRYTDQVLREIFDAFSKDGLLFLYASDHGELLHDKMFGHGYVPAYQNEYRVPFLAWSSKPERLGRLNSQVGDQVVNTESFDDITRFLLGFDDDLNKVSFSRRVLDASRAVVVYDQLKNYDMNPDNSMRISAND